ncbi:MAG TPA: sulfate reduction electron transfer complex DsrMKJOP subunit DsrM, partial [Thermodesulfobacteriota bacterium]|nr:sulfate reduction electron transfer complex DsrMKJOP subunit DsrM [Thermodesulfobacteriota bacterium]
MEIGFSLCAVALLALVPWLGVGEAGGYFLFGVILPYVAFATFLIGVVYRVTKWARSPVPFRIPTTCGQEKSLPWIKNSKLENPYNTTGVIGRMALEVLLFRSLFRNTKIGRMDQKVVYGSAKWLWLGGLIFHWSFLFILLRHLRFFTEPVLPLVNLVAGLDGFFQIGVPTFYLTDAAILLAVTYLFLRRVALPQVRYLSLSADYFPLLLILGISLSGVLMRHIYKVDLLRVKEWAMGLASFHPVIPEGIGLFFFVHLFLVNTLIAYFPMSKLMHMGGVFLSPTRNLANNNRMRRH